jgi:hypothetical protein
VLTINDLPDDDLLAIFQFYVVRYQDLDFNELIYVDYDTKKKLESWKLLVHVCRRWRGLVFGSPRGLNLQIFYKAGSPARRTLAVWPALPLLIQGDIFPFEMSVTYAIVGLKHNDRICQINLVFHTTYQIEKVWTAMQVPFPEIAVLCLSYRDQIFSNVPVLPDSLLGGSAPRLRYLALDVIPFPGLPKLLLSATHLVNLWLTNIPDSGYISPESMATCLSMLTSLESFRLEFKSVRYFPDHEAPRSPPPTCCILPALAVFSFKGVKEYLEDLLSRIETPQLYRLSTTFSNDIDFIIPELIELISRMTVFGAYNEARLIFNSRDATIRLQSHPTSSDHKMVDVRILSHLPTRQLSPPARICTLLLHLFLTIENLYMDENEHSPVVWKNDIENTEWLDLLLPFTAVKNLYISRPLTPRIAPALQELTGGRTTEVLPALQNVFLQGFTYSKPIEEGIAQFISARQLINHPVVISIWNRNRNLVWDSDGPQFDD